MANQRLRTARLHHLITSSTPQVSASTDPHTPTRASAFCQGAASDNVIVAIRRSRRNYMFLLEMPRDETRGNLEGLLQVALLETHKSYTADEFAGLCLKNRYASATTGLIR